MPDFSHRSNQVEIMDDLTCGGKVVDQTLIELDVINKWLGGNAVTLNGLSILLKSQIHNSNLTIADLGCGGGDMLKVLANVFRRKKISASFTGIDANPNIISIAKANAQSFAEINFQTQDILSTPFRHQHYDIIIATLFFHHFTSTQLIDIFSHLKKQAAVGIVINDLHRHWLAYYSIKLLTRFFSKSPMVQHDGPLSVLRGFRRTDLEKVLSAAGITNYTLTWKWAFRWQLVIRC